MDIAEILRHILIVLIAAKLAAEVAERLGIPAVVGEIVAGILVGPSVLNAVGGGDEVLRTLGELGVILLLLDVGLEMDLRELGKVGRSSFLVATVGVVAPMVMGFAAMRLMGEDVNTSLFVGAALTATSVGITARVFGDLKALATTEARIVLGAAVADDVMGLVVLTVVVRLVTEGSVSLLSVSGIVAVAVAFLAVGGLVGLRIGPPLFGAIQRLSRSTGTLVALALAFTLAFAELADLARLAPIVGAFVAGIALSKARPAAQIRRELSSVGHLFIPVFFLQIGIDADVGAFFRAEVLRDAAILLAVAAVGKLLSPLGAMGAPGDKVLIGLGMLPRGEVGLIFATIGLQQGVLSDALYASLLLVVLITTLVTPQLLKVRYATLRRGVTGPDVPMGTPPPAGGWLRVDRDDVGLAGTPPTALAPAIALDAALAVARRRPVPELVTWLADSGDAPVRLDDALMAKVLDVVEFGTARSWRFLESSGILHRLLPELAEALRDRERDPFSLDPLSGHHFSALERRRRLHPDDPLALELDLLVHGDRLLLAALLVEAFEQAPDPLDGARRTLARMPLEEADRSSVLGLVADQDLLWSASHQPGALDEGAVLPLADHLDSPEQARSLYLLSALRADGRERWELQRLRALHELIQVVLADESVAGTDARCLADQRRRAAAALVDGRGARARIESAPRAYVLRTSPETLARHARLLDPPPGPLRVETTPEAGDGTRIDVAGRDRPGVLAAIASVLTEHGLAVEEAVLARWSDGVVLDSFRVDGGAVPPAATLAAEIAGALDGPIAAPPLLDAEVSFDTTASPWHTVLEVVVSDRPGVLHAVSAALAAAGIEVRSAQLSSLDGLVIDRLHVTDREGGKVGVEAQQRFRDLLEQGVELRRARFGRRSRRIPVPAGR
ncbi:MAG TPA: cation:proton antiporter [Acidimicrobiales bacterium]|nr:cation:proton antiporter [Acidimicrobiales bacterium]